MGVTGRIATNYLPNGQKTIFSYLPVSNDLRLQTLWHRESHGDVLSKFDYTYNVDGQIKTWTQHADVGIRCFLVRSLALLLTVVSRR